jgi:hypothetical protein
MTTSLMVVDTTITAHVEEQDVEEEAVVVVGELVEVDGGNMISMIGKLLQRRLQY